MSNRPKDITLDPLKKDFIKILTDFGFKRVFGSRERSDILKRFLNALFEGEFRITAIEYRDKEILPFHANGKKVLFDIYCTTDAGKHFIIEMQQEESENFPDRILFYVCNAIVHQGVKGIEYDLDPVYCVVLTNFNMAGRQVRLLKEMLIMEKNTHEVYTENVKLIFIALPEVPTEWEKCDTELLRLLYLIKNMEDMTKTSKPYLSGEYEELFDAASTGKLTTDEAVRYSQSYFKECDNQSAIRFAERRSHAEGRAEGAMSMLKQMVQNLRKKGYDNFSIASLLDKPSDLIATL